MYQSILSFTNSYRNIYVAEIFLNLIIFHNHDLLSLHCVLYIIKITNLSLAYIWSEGYAQYFYCIELI
jgi:hypothetical protein